MRHIPTCVQMQGEGQSLKPLHDPATHVPVSPDVHRSTSQPAPSVSRVQAVVSSAGVPVEQLPALQLRGVQLRVWLPPVSWQSAVKPVQAP